MIRAVQLRKEYRMGDSIVRALDGVDLVIESGEFVSVTGASGSGKSTLMHILGCLDRPTDGTLEFNGQLISSTSERRLADIRNQQIGFVFQTFNLINRTSAVDNVCVPLMYGRRSFTREPARLALSRVGLAQRATHRPSEMSGGECQRVAIARAIVNNPKLLLADEPTGNLDTRTSEQIMTIFHELHATGITIVLVTHEPDIAIQADRMIHMRDGKIVEDVRIDDERRDVMLSAPPDWQKRMTQKKPARRAGSPPRLASGL
jgi:putative ABC transport system ATP-binding protein